MKNTFFAVLGALIILGSLYLFLDQPAPAKYQGLTLIQIGQTELKVTLAQTPAERSRGLSGRETLGDNEGMLFIYEEPSQEGFWMKDMNFPIDIIWVDPEMRVIGFEKSVSPDTFPEIFYSPGEVQYVLETSAGFVERSNLKVGDLLKFRHR